LKKDAISIKIFDVEKEKVVYDFIRGFKKGGIYDMAFTDDENFLAVLSHSLTLHIFELKDLSKNKKKLKKQGNKKETEEVEIEENSSEE
jgi:hypothetical protein